MAATDEQSLTVFTDATVQSLIELGRRTAGPTVVQKIDGNPVPFIINNGIVTPLPQLVFNEHAERPERIKGNISVFDPASFEEYYASFADEQSRIFADDSKRSVVAVLDYHLALTKEKLARWGQHRVTLNLRHSEEWNTWIAGNNKQMTQQQFSEFLEQNSMDIVQPSPAAIVEVARDLQGTTEVEFGAGLRTQDGQVRFKYTETTKTTVGAAAVSVPETFTIGVPVFVGGNPGPIQALLRYRCKEGKLTFWYTLVRPEQYVRAAFNDARELIASNLGVTIINGVPA
jgi:uncharacterized protein YfdQ (DUF2303 family)